MLAIGLVLNTLGIGLFCWAIIALAVYALPFFVALIIGMMTFHSDAGLIGAMLIATAGGALTLVLGGQIFAGQAVARDYGQQGAVWPVIEPDLLQQIHARLQHLEKTGETARLNEDLKRRTIARVKRPVPVANLFRTFDLRQVRICSPTGVETFDFTRPPEKDGCKTHKVLWKLKKGEK